MVFAHKQPRVALPSPDYTLAANISEPLLACVTHIQKFEVYFMDRENESDFFLHT